MPLELDRIVDVDAHGVRYKQLAPALQFKLAGKEFDIHPLEMPLYFGDVRSADQFSFLARTASQLGVYFRHGLKNLPDPKNKTSRKRRERKLKATHETQLALMALAPLLKLNRYSQCTQHDFNEAIKDVKKRINEIFAAKDGDVINNALKTIIENRLKRIADAATGQSGGNIDVTALHLYSDVVDLSEALLQGLQERSNLELAARGALRWRFRGDNLYANIQRAKVFVRDPQNQRRGHGQALNDSNFGLFGPHEQQQEADVQEEEHYFDPTHYGMDEASIVEYCDYLEAVEVSKNANKTAEQEEQAIFLATPERETLAEQLKDERSKHRPTKAAVTKNSWYLHRAGENNLLVAGPAAFTIAGAALGTIVPVIGTAIGAIVGAGVGYLAAAAHHGIVVEGQKNGGYSGFGTRLLAGLAAPVTYVINALEVAARPVVRWSQKALLGWGSIKHPKLELISSAASELTHSDPQTAVEDKKGLAKDEVAKAGAQGSAKAKKPAVPVTAPTQLTLDTGGGLSSIPAAVAVFAKHVTDPLTSVFRSNPNIGVVLHAFLWGPLGAITALKAAGLNNLSHIELSLVKAYDFVSSTFSGSTGTLGAMWAWVVPGKILELVFLDKFVNPGKQTELFGHFFERLAQLENDPHHSKSAFAAKKLMQTVLMLALTGAAANLAAPLIAEAFKAVGMDVDFGSNPVGEVWNDILITTKGSALATSMMLFNNQPEHIMRDTTAVLANIIENHGKGGKKHVQNICNNLEKLQQLSPEAYSRLTPLRQADVRARFHDLKKVFGVELMYALVPGEKFGIRPPAPTSLLGKAINWAVSVPIGTFRTFCHPITVGLPAVANFVSGCLALGAVTKQFVSGLSSKVLRGNTLMNWVGRVISGGNNHQGVAENLLVKYDNQRPKVSGIFSIPRYLSRLQHSIQRGLTNLMHRCTAYAMAGKNTLPKSPGVVKAELKAHRIEVLDGHPVFQGDRLDREPEPDTEAHPDPELAREPEPEPQPRSLLDDAQQRGSESPTAPTATASTTASPSLLSRGDTPSTSPRGHDNPFAPGLGDDDTEFADDGRALTSQPVPATTVTASALLNDLCDGTRQPVPDQAASTASAPVSTPFLLQAAAEAESTKVSQSLPKRDSQSPAAMGQ
ncbi:hypothetical protein PsalMR5_03309 [Piscirickettsia salmonis]|uniref:hypothetical protein n=1 Tax=Piscirickettsia salmonis TaxID=1238 RepID=UPI0012BAF452|nr:hypothetical protein [Piscirickettsia salmonis]QGP55840.1 hypothetical protein PsalSR1_03304 [Piscirickettsia salmonis]QGP58292.1 hypothetical protein PsalBI1_00853 [Piscirickettsia salmonis]QGP65409.1 hypothetical protein PsalMR5_03309 [Piscirickettsia salmonis]